MICEPAGRGAKGVEARTEAANGAKGFSPTPFLHNPQSAGKRQEGAIRNRKSL